MNEEVQRLKTYAKWPKDAPVTAESCAKAGFYSTGKDLEVECYFCGIRISEWQQGDIPLGKHVYKSPECPIILDPFSFGNIPILENVHRKASDYLSYQSRLQSFQQWKYADIVTSESLAGAGFYSLHPGDAVKCAYCHGVVSQWEPGDDPKIEHKKLFPKCRLVLADFNYENLDQSNKELRTSYSQHHVTFNATSGPCHPNYKNPDDRMRSFKNWPPDKTQTPEAMVDAGFFYSGSNDKVRCFYCNGTLKSWQPGDDVWVEHAKWFPHCLYVLERKGVDFIELHSGVRAIDLDLDPDIEFSGPSKSS